jgi:hypothetical protein
VVAGAYVLVDKFGFFGACFAIKHYLQDLEAVITRTTAHRLGGFGGFLLICFHKISLIKIYHSINSFVYLVLSV